MFNDLTIKLIEEKLLRIIKPDIDLTHINDGFLQLLLERKKELDSIVKKLRYIEENYLPKAKYKMDDDIYKDFKIIRELHRIESDTYEKLHKELEIYSKSLDSKIKEVDIVFLALMSIKVLWKFDHFISIYERDDAINELNKKVKELKDNADMWCDFDREGYEWKHSLGKSIMLNLGKNVSVESIMEDIIIRHIKPSRRTIIPALCRKHQLDAGRLLNEENKIRNVKTNNIKSNRQM